MNQPVYLICGVPGSGKTWIARQLQGKFSYVAHDEYPVATYATAIIQMATMSNKPVLAECPFRMSVLIGELEAAGLTVYSYFIKEPEHLIASRYQARQGKTIPNQHLTNYRRLLQAERAWKVASGNEILELLRTA